MMTAPTLDAVYKNPASVTGLPMQILTAMLMSCNAVSTTLTALLTSGPFRVETTIDDPQRLLKATEVAEMLGTTPGVVYEMARWPRQHGHCRKSRSAIYPPAGRGFHQISRKIGTGFRRALERCVSLPETDARIPLDHIRKIVQRSGNPVWQVNGRKFGFGRPQFATKELAEAELADMIKKRGEGLSPGRRDVTFAEQAETFLKHVADGLAEKTLRSYRGHLNVHILPRFENHRVCDINTPMIKALLFEKRQPIPTVRMISANPKKSRVIDAADFDAITMKLWPVQDAGASRQLSSTTVRLTVLRLRQLKRAAADSDYIFGNGVIPLGARGLSKHFELAMRECGISGHVMYDCRHTFASVLLQRCRDVVYVAKILADPATTLKYYSHFLAGTSRAYVDLLDASEKNGSDLAVVANHATQDTENAA